MGHPSMPPTYSYPSPCSKKSRSSQIQPYTPNGKWRRIVDDLQCEVDVNTVMFMLYVSTWDLLMQPHVLLDREQLHYTSVCPLATPPKCGSGSNLEGPFVVVLFCF